MSKWKESEVGKIPSNWVLKTVGDLVKEKIIDKPIDGNHGNIHPKGKDFVESGIPFIMASDIANNKVDLCNCKFITKEQADSLQKGFSKEGDVLLTHKATLGRTAIVKDLNTPYIMLTPQVTYYRVLNEKLLSNKFLKFYFDSTIFQGILENHGNSGSTRAYVGITAQRKLPILIPPPSEQKAIAEVLSNLDDKIDLLHRQNQTLEAMAETLFRQWFVEEAVALKPLGDCIQTTSGGTPSRKKMEFYQNGTTQWVKSKELNRGYLLDTEEKITEDAVNNSSAKLLPENSVLIAMYGATVGEFAIIGQEATCNQAICACIPNRKFPYTYVYYAVKANEEELKNMAVGSAQQNISQVLIKSLDIPVDEKKILLFHEEVDSLMKKIKLNFIQIRTLEKMRDTLLPKLMSREVRVC